MAEVIRKGKYTTVEWNGNAVQFAVSEAEKEGLLKTASDCVQTAKDLVATDTTRLQGAIRMGTVQRRGNVLSVMWGAFNSKYAIFVELGTGPHMPPVDALRGWAKRKLGDADLAWPVAINISKYGTKEQPYLRPSADEHYPELARNINKAKARGKK